MQILITLKNKIYLEERRDSESSLVLSVHLSTACWLWQQVVGYICILNLNRRYNKIFKMKKGMNKNSTINFRENGKEFQGRRENNIMPKEKKSEKKNKKLMLSISMHCRKWEHA